MWEAGKCFSRAIRVATTISLNTRLLGTIKKVASIKPVFGDAKAFPADRTKRLSIIIGLGNFGKIE